jgi:hypothetical protein
MKRKISLTLVFTLTIAIVALLFLFAVTILARFLNKKQSVFEQPESVDIVDEEVEIEQENGFILLLPDDFLVVESTVGDFFEDSTEVIYPEENDKVVPPINNEDVAQPEEDEEVIPPVADDEQIEVTQPDNEYENNDVTSPEEDGSGDVTIPEVEDEEVTTPDTDEDVTQPKDEEVTEPDTDEDVTDPKDEEVTEPDTDEDVTEPKDEEVTEPDTDEDVTEPEEDKKVTEFNSAGFDFKEDIKNSMADGSGAMLWNLSVNYNELNASDLLAQHGLYLVFRCAYSADGINHSEWYSFAYAIYNDETENYNSVGYLNGYIYAIQFAVVNVAPNDDYMGGYAGEELSSDNFVAVSKVIYNPHFIEDLAD